MNNQPGPADRSRHTLGAVLLLAGGLAVAAPAVSRDGGATWRWLGPEAVRGPTFRFAFPADAADVRFAFAFPYVGHDLRDFLKGHGNSPHLKVETLCKTRKGRD